MEVPMQRLRMGFGHLNEVLQGVCGTCPAPIPWGTGPVSYLLRLWQVKIWGSWQGLAVGQLASGRADVRSSSSISCLPF